MDINISLNLILYIAGAIVSISAAVKIVSSVVTKAIKRTFETEFAAELAEESKIFKNQLLSEISAVHSDLKKFKEESIKADEQIKRALMRDMRNVINDAYNKYVIDKNPIDSHTLFVLNEISESYTEFGGNSFAATQIQEIRKVAANPPETLHKRSSVRSSGKKSTKSSKSNNKPSCDE